MTMSGGFTVSPASLDLRDHVKDRAQQPRRDISNNYSYNYNNYNPNQKGPTTPIESHLLSPYSSHVRSNSASPTNNFNTPADSVSTDIYQSSDLGSEFDDALLSVDFNNLDSGMPHFLEDFDNTQNSFGPHTTNQDNGNVDTQYPLSPHQTPSIQSTSAFDSNAEAGVDSNAPAEPQYFSNEARPSTNSVDSNQSAPQLTPDTNGDSFSSDDNPIPTALAMATRSPRVTVSMWNQGKEAPIQGVERPLNVEMEAPSTTHASYSLAGDLAGEVTHENQPAVFRDAHGNWLPHSTAGYRGLAPGNRPSEEVPSPNQQAARRERDEKNKEVFEWVSRSTGDRNDFSGGSDSSSNRVASGQSSENDNIPDAEIPLGNTTENRHLPGQTYLNVDGSGGPLTHTDFDIMRQISTWGDAPAIHAIQSDRKYQPETSQAAIEKFNRQCQDNDSIVSRAATWGTRRRSLPSIVDMEGIISGNFLKKLSISGHSRRPSFMKRIPSLVRKPSGSQIRKRKGSNASEIPQDDSEDQERRESKDTLAPPSRTSSWGISSITKKPTPSLNTALVGMATGAASIGTTHARSGSISAMSMTSPKSPFGSLNVPPVKNALRRQRSKTELPKGSNFEALSHPHLVGMLKRQGGPPVASLARTQPAPEQDEDDDDDEEGFDEADIKPEPNKLKPIEPTLAGFREHIHNLNPLLPSENSWLVERIAHQMLARYKQLQTAKIRHLQVINQQSCSSGTMCLAMGGSAIPLDSKGGERGFDPLSARPDSSDGDAAPLEGGINSESFPPGIPMPPTMSLPAEFECRLCFASKKFQKPSDWTKHVHEDVQPFTCTWERCRDPKMFKRKADWVRHENEGHRHLEWWICDVEDCRHVCYRRDNFLQHLVREHKYTEPKIKTKAAIKKAGNADRTWLKVEQCHVETLAKPSDEPCRFCRKTFPTWKKLTVHLAKHMEHISLPVLEVVDRKEVDADTLISPIQDPPRPSFPIPPVKQEPQPFTSQSVNTTPNTIPMEYAPNNLTYGSTQVPLQNPYYAQHQMTQSYAEMSSNRGHPLMMPPTYNNPQSQYHALPVTSAPSYGSSTNAYMNLQPQPQPQPQSQQEGLEPFPQFEMNPLGIQDSTGSLGYENFAPGGMQPVEQYGSHPGSVSPYNHSPHQGHGSFYS
ncbi:uncharacterized protein F4822DRAFT_320768 [Hypoxylon trugodes]|uniref:uncharacterized protein n=1 Tax=Hypoxylon trugodes TaxID=326681 RepID=UPI002190B10A|nr:uncharacterized protein F4822DRAFT_320768 [Hypoxylon trugodes]KAI1386585.1 hypothetical protein F4822DRAFT_320768 [Hypoxylon trugodes]